ncbi:MAG: oligopeptide transporter, OPT family [Candidatus Thermoplasmatota archaeon]|jgi:putative OPT family oligopeptide transporter|nr:oligopeptide transporter, OPT family [Candidatus Thermoplasmatota archaeon]
MNNRENFKSYVSADKSIPELTIKAILVGVLLAVILGAANAYLGLYAGMTVSAIIPGAVVALTILRPFKGTILEINLATMGASAGECVAAGVIFTIPALILLGVWNEIHYLETTLISLLGGLLGVLWMVPLRRALVVKTDLPFPEGVAVAAVLTTTVGGETAVKRKKESGVRSIWLVVGAFIAAFYKFGESALNIFSGNIENIISVGKYNIFGKVREGWLYGGLTTSPALLGVGWIIGPEISSYVMVGGLIGWVIITPLVMLTSGMPVNALNPMDGFFIIWGEQIRYIGVGAMLVGGLWAIWKIRNNLAESIKEAVTGIKGGQIKTTKRTDQDLSYKLVFILIILITIPIFIVYIWLSNMIEFSLFMAIVTVLFAFLASALAGYLTGLVGSSNCPISGVTVTVLLIVSVLMLILGVTSPEAMAIAIFISAVICIGGSISGDLLQSMACGQMLGATPKKLQISMTFGVIAVSLVVGPVIGILHQAYEIGSAKLSAPQAFLMKGIVKGVLGGEMLWPYIIVGMVLAIVLILINLPVLPVAIGIYLPFTLSIPIFTGGVIRYFTDKMLKKKYPLEKEEEISTWELAIKQTAIKPKEKVIRTGLLLTAGLVAGEALMGVFIALLFVGGVNLNVFNTAPWLPGLLVWIYIAILLAYIPIRIVTNK